MNMDRFRAPDASDEKARCQGQCQRSMHYTLLVDGYCEDCRNDEDQDNDMTEKEMRELDFWIAERVMGWKRGAKWGNGNGEWIIDGKGYDHHHTSFGQTPRFTTDPAAAMQVLEKCIGKTPLEKIEILKAGDEWLVQYFDDPVYESEQDSTLPLAICLIAQRIFRHETKT